MGESAPAYLTYLPTYPARRIFVEDFFLFFDDVHWHVCLYMNIASVAHVTFRLEIRRDACVVSRTLCWGGDWGLQ